MKTNELKRSYAFEVFSKMLDYHFTHFSFEEEKAPYTEIANSAINVTNQIFNAFKEEAENEN